MAENRIDSRATVVGDVKLGSGNVVEAGAVLVGPLVIGDDNFFGPNCVVGTPAEDDATSRDLLRDGIQAEGVGGATIGSRNVIRELVTVHRGLTGDTVIGSDCYIMARSHVPHDAVVSDSVKMATNSHLGGYTFLGRGSYVGLSAVLHQFTVVGAYSMVGMGSVVTLREVPPGSLLYGNPARLQRPNTVALERIGINTTDWWHRLAGGDAESDAPSALHDDLTAFRAACARAVELRASVSAWRAARMGAENRGAARD